MLNAIALIRHFEGCHLQAYRCPGGVWTIGWGNTFYADGTPVQKGDRITQQEADRLNVRTVEVISQDLDDALRVRIPYCYRTALISFCYNFSVPIFLGSTLCRMLHARADLADLQYQIRRWNKVNGRVSAGLVRRRNCEAACMAGLPWRDYTQDYALYNNAFTSAT
jgi:GH24 family phage-related lysozyme (muramidase)